MEEGEKGERERKRERGRRKTITREVQMQVGKRTCHVAHICSGGTTQCTTVSAPAYTVCDSQLTAHQRAQHGNSMRMRVRLGVWGALTTREGGAPCHMCE